MISAERILACTTSKRLHLTILPTEACNFRCVYCFEDFRLARMKPGVVRGLERLLEKRIPRLERLHLSWFGGEPLLAMDIIEDVHTHVRALGREHPDLRFSADITTNAYRLEQSVFRRLLGLGVSEYQITFDGPPEWHDRRRLRADGQKTFDVIWSNLLAMARVDQPFDVLVRLHVCAENHKEVPRFLDLYEQAFVGDARFRLFMRRVGRFGGPNDATLPVLDQEEGESVLRVLKDQASERGLDAAIEGESRGICLAARPNSFVIRADGRLNKCHVAQGHPANQVGLLTEHGELELDEEKLPAWRRGFISGDRDELHCPKIGLDAALQTD